MKTYNFIAVFFIGCFILSNTACKKNTNEVTAVVEEATQAKVQSDDADMVQGETESADDDVNNSAATSERFCGAGNFYGSPFTLQDATITLPTATFPKLTIVYNGSGISSTCKRRTGTITVELINGNRWIDSGAILKYVFTNFKVENVCTQKSITINGERFVTNVYGGNLYRLRNGLVNSLTHRIRTGTTGYQVTFTDSSGSKTANWNVAKRTSIRYVAGDSTYYFEANGDTTIGAKANTESWGFTRFGKSYQTVFSAAIKANTGCKLWRPTAGEIVHYVSNTIITVKYGLDAIGNPVDVNDCATRYRVNWILANGTPGGGILYPYRF